MEFRLKLMKVTEKSWNFEIMAKSHGICISTNLRRYPAKKIQPTGFVLILCGHGILSFGHGKVMEFCHRNFVATLM